MADQQSTDNAQGQGNMYGIENLASAALASRVSQQPTTATTRQPQHQPQLATTEQELWSILQQHDPTQTLNATAAAAAQRSASQQPATAQPAATAYPGYAYPAATAASYQYANAMAYQRPPPIPQATPQPPSQYQQYQQYLSYPQAAAYAGAAQAAFQPYSSPDFFTPTAQHQAVHHASPAPGSYGTPTPATATTTATTRLSAAQPTRQSKRVRIDPSHLREELTGDDDDDEEDDDDGLTPHLPKHHETIPAQPAPPIQLAPGVRFVMGTHPSALTGRPKSCIPNIFAKDWARECVEAAINSRLPPYALSKDEYDTFKGAINHVQVTNYLNIRNAVLWLWLRNPLCPVSREEAFGVCRDDRFVPLAEKIFEYLVRGGYINNGVIPIPSPLEVLGQVHPERSKSGKVVVVVGSGIAGLGAARQLEGLFRHFANRFPEDEELPKVMVVEARSRIGGRVYSRPIKADTRETLDLGGDARQSTAEMGAMIVTGFDYGNPLGVLIKKQLALPYHHLRETDLHDETGEKVDKDRDVRVERMFNDVLDRAAGFKEARVQPKLVEGNKWDLDLGRDPSSEGGKTIAEVEKGEAEIPPMSGGAGAETGISTPSNDSVFGAGLERMTGRPWHATGTAGKVAPVEALRRIGFEVEEKDVDPFQPRPASEPTLGDTMDAILLEFKQLAKLTPEDMRMVNWHYANLEYANAANLRKLSLKHWDQDDGNEFRGAHSMVVGGYGQLARALALAPEKLDIKLRKSVQTVVYSDAQTMINGTMYQQPPVRVICHDGDVIGADAVIVTLPLGVLKSGDVAFEPALPEWKMDAISRLGFGLLNKVVLVYDECFWDREADMVGVLREPENGKDAMDQESYVDVRGRFYMFWNCYRTAGKPVLVALMAGNAAEAVEKEDDDVLIEEATTVLRKMHPGAHVPQQPRESIVTRWKKDPYAKGSYSYVGPKATGEDYDLLQKDVDGRVYFAGEATCRTHPATVHGAYLSGLKAAKEVLEHFIGPINVPTDKHIVVPTEIATAMAKVKVESRRTQYKESWTQKAKRLKRERVQAAEEACEAALVEKLGEKPMKAKRRPANPFLVFQKESWSRIKAEADRIHQERTGNPNAKASRDEIRALLGKAWRDMSEDEQKPYREFTESNKAANSGSVADFNNQLLDWERQAETFRKTFMDSALTESPSAEEAEANRMAAEERAERMRLMEERKRYAHLYGPQSDDEDYEDEE